MKSCFLTVTLTIFTTTAGIASAQDITSEKGKLSYAIGYNLGGNLARLTESGEAIDINTVTQGLQDAYTKKQPAIPADQMRTVYQGMQDRQLAKAKAAFEKASAENKAKSDAFLAQNKSKPGVKTLPSGVQYRVIKDGSGAKPTPSSEVQLQFKGSLSDGQVFTDTTSASNGQQGGPITAKVSQIPLPGLREVVTQMSPGANWEVVLPPNLAYGNAPDASVGPNQVVVFDLTLISVK